VQEVQAPALTLADYISVGKSKTRASGKTKELSAVHRSPDDGFPDEGLTADIAQTDVLAVWTCKACTFLNGTEC
jgi:hypothetical protein